MAPVIMTTPNNLNVVSTEPQAFTIVSGSTDETVKAIDSDGNEVWTFSGHTGGVRAVSIGSNGNVYSGSLDNTLRKIDSDGNEIWSFTGHTDIVRDVATNI